MRPVLLDRYLLNILWLCSEGGRAPDSVILVACRVRWGTTCTIKKVCRLVYPMKPTCTDLLSALDNIITQLMENSNAHRPVPASEEIMDKLPREVLEDGCELAAMRAASIANDLQRRCWIRIALCARISSPQT